MRAFPPIRDLVTDVSWNFRVKQRIKPFKPRAPDAPDGTWRMAQADVDRVQEFRKCIECFLCQDVCHVLRDHQLHDEFIGPRFLVHAAALEMHPLDVEDRVADLRRAHGIGYCNITKCCTEGVPGAHHHHRQRDHSAQGAGGGRVLRPGGSAAQGCSAGGRPRRDQFDLKPISRAGVPAALQKAERYRLHQRPVVGGEHLSRRAGGGSRQSAGAGHAACSPSPTSSTGAPPRACGERGSCCRGSSDEYKRAYYAGIICERCAKAQLRPQAPGAGEMAYDWLPRGDGLVREGRGTAPRRER